MKLLVGLGNPGTKHRLNRHNLGFLVVEAWSLLKGQEVRKQEFKSLTARAKVGNEDVLVMLPQTFMNRSGEAVQEAMQFFKLGVEDIIVVHDEIDLPARSFKIKRGGGTGGNNGLKSIVPFGENFIRFRMGVGRPEHPGMDVADYVLGNLTQEDMDFWEKEMADICAAIDLCIEGKMETAMNKYHRKPVKE